MWGPVALVVAGVLAPALVEFLDFPLRSQLWLLILAVHPLAYLVALGFVAAAVVVANHLGTVRDAVLVGLISATALAGQVAVDLDRWYPVANFNLHRDRFERAAVEAHLARPAEGNTERLALPWWLDDLARPEVEISSVGGKVVVTAIVTESDGLSRGYLYAPWLRRAQEVDRLRPEFPLGSGWWWVESG
jgi:hypothetical protein